MAHEWAKGLLVTLLLTGLLFTVIGVDAWLQETPRQETFDGLADSIFNKWVFPFEVLSLFLLVALFGALYMGAKIPRREPPPPPETPPSGGAQP